MACRASARKYERQSEGTGLMNSSFAARSFEVEAADLYRRSWLAILTEKQWDVVERHLPHITRQYRECLTYRNFIDTVLWLARYKKSWAGYSTEYQRSRIWANRGVWQTLIGAIREADPTFAYVYDQIQKRVVYAPTTIAETSYVCTDI
jgi:hypothetical protein